jgi:hypothetical protein
MGGKEKAMIELTEQQRQALREHSGEPLRLMDPTTQQTFVLIPQEVYERLKPYDDSPWTAEEMDLLAAEAGEMLDSFRKNS